MLALLYGIALFLLSLFVHLSVWKVKLPKRQTKALVQIFSGTLVVGTLILPSIPLFSYECILYIPQSLPEYIHICFLFISLALAYIITYSAIEADSPSLVVILKIAEAGAQGLERSKLIETMNDDVLVKPRINDLITDKMAYIEANKYKLTSKGLLMLSVITLYRKMLNEGKGG